MTKEVNRALREWIDEARWRERAQAAEVARLRRQIEEDCRREAARAMKEELERCRQKR